MIQDFRALPKVKDSWTHLYVEHGKIEQDTQSVAIFDAEGKTPIPCAMLSLLMLGPGTAITHAAIKTLADNGCLVIWVGEQNVRFYAQGMGETRSSHRLLRQAYLCSNHNLRLAVARKMYEMRFNEPIPIEWSLQQIREKEGVRVREAYAQASRDTGVEWVGRSYSRSQWDASDPINRALSSANSCLYGICHAAIVSAGYSPALGFVHTGKMLSFVYDVADLYKTEISIPAAFEVAKEVKTNIEREVRTKCRELFKDRRLLARIVDDLNRLMILDSAWSPDDEILYDDDAAAPGKLWDGDNTPVDGGENFADQ